MRHRKHSLNNQLDDFEYRGLSAHVVKGAIATKLFESGVLLVRGGFR